MWVGLGVGDAEGLAVGDGLVVAGGDVEAAAVGPPVLAWPVAVGWAGGVCRCDRANAYAPPPAATTTTTATITKAPVIRLGRCLWTSGAGGRGLGGGWYWYAGGGGIGGGSYSYAGAGCVGGMCGTCGP
ncbi:MAG TPA: hypothetical protein VN714_35560 [Trebonia sp.]|nr:hypothetical protein [Trebonia sp.]